MPPPPPPDPRAGHGVESPSVVRAPDRHMSRGTSSRRPLRPRRWSDISPEASPLLQSAQGERYGERQHHRARDESRGSESPPSSSKRCRRLEGGRKGSPIGGRHWSDDDDDDDDEGTGSRGQYDHELAYPSSCHRARHHLGSNNKRTFSPRHHGERSLSVQHHPSPRGKPQLPLPMEMSPWDDGYTSPSSPSYPREVEQYRQRGLHDDDDQDMTPGCLYSAPGSSDGSGISGREPSFKYEDSVLNTECKDFAYDALVDDFMDAVVKTWRNRNPNLKVDKDAHQKQTNRFAELALKRYNKNKNNKVKYALVEATDGGAIFEDSEIYAHVNFYAKAKNGPKKHDGKVLVFAELHQVGRRLNAMVLTCFRFLDENNQLCGRRDQIPNSLIMQNQDMGHCYACTGKINHPDGSCYKAGHIVSTLCYLPN